LLEESLSHYKWIELAEIRGERLRELNCDNGIDISVVMALVLALLLFWTSPTHLIKSQPVKIWDIVFFRVPLI
jgi:hypothetical protein